MYGVKPAISGRHGEGGGCGLEMAAGSSAEEYQCISFTPLCVRLKVVTGNRQ